jgi:hypothetical protein
MRRPTSYSRARGRDRLRCTVLRRSGALGCAGGVAGEVSYRAVIHLRLRAVGPKPPHTAPIHLRLRAVGPKPPHTAPIHLRLRAVGPKPSHRAEIRYIPATDRWAVDRRCTTVVQAHFWLGRASEGAARPGAWRLAVLGGHWPTTIVSRGAQAALYGTQPSTVAKRGCPMATYGRSPPYPITEAPGPRRDGHLATPSPAKNQSRPDTRRTEVTSARDVAVSRPRWPRVHHGRQPRSPSRPVRHAALHNREAWLPNGHTRPESALPNHRSPRSAPHGHLATPPSQKPNRALTHALECA